MKEPIQKTFDQFINRTLGMYAGFKPKHPNALVIPQFVGIESSIPCLAEGLSRYIELSKLKKPLILSDGITWEIAGKELFNDLAQADLSPRKELVKSNIYSEAARIVHSVTTEPRSMGKGKVPWEKRIYAPKRISAVFGVGGGTVIDIAKLVAWQLNLPCVSIPTSLANDGIASPFAVIRPAEKLGAVTVQTNTPLGVLIDLGRIKPKNRSTFFSEMMRSGIGDAVSNLTSTLDWRLASSVGTENLDYLALLHARSAGEVLLSRLNSGSDIYDDDFILTLASGLVSSGEAMTRVGSSRPASGFEHKLYHAFQNILSYRAQASHGVLVAIGSLISAKAHNEWFKPMYDGFSSIGLPVCADDLKQREINPKWIENAIEVSIKVKPDRYTILEHLGSESLIKTFHEIYC